MWKVYTSFSFMRNKMYTKKYSATATNIMTICTVFCNIVSNFCSWVLAFMWQVSQNYIFFNYCFRIFVFNLITHNCISQLCSIDGTLSCYQGYKLDRAQNTCICTFFSISYKYTKESRAYYLIPKRKRFPKSLSQYLQEEI